LLIRKNSFEELKRLGMSAFREAIRLIAPYLGERVGELEHWEEIKLLSVQINRLRQWHRPGLLCIGDAAHAMSPVGGVGINLAIQDAVATANLLIQPLLDGSAAEPMLAAVQRRREFPTRITQFMQMNAHRALDRVFQNPGPSKAPWQLRAAVRIPGVQHVLGWAVGIGVRPEHVTRARAVPPLRRALRNSLALCTGVLIGALTFSRGLRSAVSPLRSAPL
jgi:2-polyprenyl-6-methoxyphenol hydroxylase-like FAD-dependent oxidoreductase